MSKERAQKRAAREAQRAQAQAKALAQSRRTRRWQSLRSALTSPLRAESAERSALQKARAQQNSALLSGLLLVNTAVALWWQSWGYSLIAAVASLASWPFLILIFFDRRRR